MKRPRKMIESQLMQTEKLIGAIWRAHREDHSYDLISSIKWAKRKNPQREVR